MDETVSTGADLLESEQKMIGAGATNFKVEVGDENKACEIESSSVASIDVVSREDDGEMATLEPETALNASSASSMEKETDVLSFPVVVGHGSNAITSTGVSVSVPEPEIISDEFEVVNDLASGSIDDDKLASSSKPDEKETDVDILESDQKMTGAGATMFEAKDGDENKACEIESGTVASIDVVSREDGDEMATLEPGTALDASSPSASSTEKETDVLTFPLVVGHTSNAIASAGVSVSVPEPEMISDEFEVVNDLASRSIDDNKLGSSSKADADDGVVKVSGGNGMDPNVSIIGSTHQMKLLVEPSSPPKKTPPSLAFAQNLRILESMGFANLDENWQLLEYCNNHVRQAIDMLLSGESSVIASTSSSSSSAPPTKKPRLGISSSVDPLWKKECKYCKESLSLSEENWKVLKCKHRLCSDCYKKLEEKQKSFTNKECVIVKCPFCFTISGEIIGNCPKGEMVISVISDSLDGYFGVKTIQIDYKIEYGQNKKLIHRTAYLPDVTEGRDALRRLKTAWDRKLCFKYGTTPGRTEDLIWNIPHKTAFGGGRNKFGYPDPEYFDDLREAVAEYGID